MSLEIVLNHGTAPPENRLGQSGSSSDPTSKTQSVPMSTSGLGLQYGRSQVDLDEPDQNFDIPKEAALRFLPPNYPRVYPTGKIPLRVQIFNDKSILYSVLSKPKKGVFMCNHCNNSFINFGALLDHFDHFDIQRPFKCEISDCPWKIVGFNKSRQLQRHITSVHSEREYKCEVQGCEKMFKRMDLLSRHTRSVHENMSSRFNKKLSKSVSSSGASSPMTIPGEIKELRDVKELRPATLLPGNFSQYPLSLGSDTMNEDISPTDTSFPQGSNFLTFKRKSLPISSLTNDYTTSPKISSTEIPNKKHKRLDSYYKHSIQFLTNDDG